MHAYYIQLKALAYILLAKFSKHHSLSACMRVSKAKFISPLLSIVILSKLYHENFPLPYYTGEINHLHVYLKTKSFSLPGKCTLIHLLDAFCPQRLKEFQQKNFARR